jgi:hypothetical protein
MCNNLFGQHSRKVMTCICLSLLLEHTASLQTIRMYRETAVNSLEWFVTTYNKIFRVKLENSSWTVYVRPSTLFVTHMSMSTPYSLVSLQLTLSLLMSYIYGAPCSARNFNVVYIWTYVLQRWKQSLSILLHNVSTLNQCRKFSCVTVVCKHFAS